jgi:peroxiredoxin Q/BCP
LQKDLKTLEGAGVAVVAVSYDPVEVLAKFAQKQKITFPLLSDPESKTIKEYGLLNQDAKGKTEGIPYPGTVLIDKDGVIRAKLFFDGYRERHSAADIVKAAEAIK